MTSDDSRRRAVSLAAAILFAGAVGSRSLAEDRHTQAVNRAIDKGIEDEPLVRLNAYNAMKAFFLESPPPFDPAAKSGVRKGQVGEIKSWLRKRESDAPAEAVNRDPRGRQGGVGPSGNCRLCCCLSEGRRRRAPRRALKSARSGRRRAEESPVTTDPAAM